MDKKRVFDILYVILILFLIAFMIFFFFWLRSESFQCINAPLDYYKEKMGEKVSCVCYKDLFGSF